MPESVKFAQLLTTFTLVLAWQKLVLRQDIIIMKTAGVSMLQIDRPGFFMYNTYIFVYEKQMELLSMYSYKKHFKDHIFDF